VKQNPNPREMPHILTLALQNAALTVVGTLVDDDLRINQSYGNPMYGSVFEK
jgi:hypothetical protein